jgi:hypothetical protein
MSNLTLGCDANDPHRLADFWPRRLAVAESRATTIPMVTRSSPAQAVAGQYKNQLQEWLTADEVQYRRANVGAALERMAQRGQPVRPEVEERKPRPGSLPDTTATQSTPEPGFQPGSQRDAA